MLRGRAGAPALVPPADPVGVTPLIEVGDAVPLVRHALRSRTSASVGTHCRPVADGAGDGGVEKGTAGMGHRQILAVSDLEIVPAVFREWGPFQPDLQRFANEPAWVRQFNVTSYQRIHPRAVRYVPNHGFEMGVYLHHIVHRYDNLSPMTAFVQADVPPSFARSLRCLRDNVTYTPLRNKDRTPYFMKRCDIWDNASYTRATWNCFHSYLQIFGLDTALHPPCPRFYIQNNFAVSRKAVHRYPVHTWRRALDQILNVECARDHPEWDKHASGSTEFTSNAVFGNRSLTKSRPFSRHEWAEAFDMTCLADEMKLIQSERRMASSKSKRRTAIVKP